MNLKNIRHVFRIPKWDCTIMYLSCQKVHILYIPFNFVNLHSMLEISRRTPYWYLPHHTNGLSFVGTRFRLPSDRKKSVIDILWFSWIEWKFLICSLHIKYLTKRLSPYSTNEIKSANSHLNNWLFNGDNNNIVMVSH